jgi:hypothetical protein
VSLFSSCAAFISNVGLQKPNAIVFNPCHPSPRYLDATTVFRAIYPDVFERTKKTNIQNSFGTMKEAMQHGAALAHCGEHEILYLMCLSRRLNVEFQLRPSNPNGLHFFELGFHPKPSTIKQKTVNKEDIILYNFEKKSLKQLYQQFDIRVPSDNKYFSPLGLVACFQPDEQRYHTALNGTALNDIQKQKLTKRFKQRQQEYEACVEKLQKQEKAGKLIWYNNTFIVMKYPEQGYHRKFRNAWVPVCGDRDFFL